MGSTIFNLFTTLPLKIFSISGPFGLNLLLLKLKTENWKHCNKIIFKCVNSAVGPIFNIFNVWTVLLQWWTMHKQWQNNAWIVKFVSWTVNFAPLNAWKLKKRTKEKENVRRGIQRKRWIQTLTSWKHLLSHFQNLVLNKETRI